MAFNRNNWYINSGDTGLATTTFVVPQSAVPGDAITRGVSNTLVVGPFPTITGVIYPMGTLYSTQSRQWYAAGVAVAGETGNSYQVRVNDIGKRIGQGPVSGSPVIWHPRDEPGVNGVYLGNSGVLNTSGLPLGATDPVGGWMDQSAFNYHLTQTATGLWPTGHVAELSGNNYVSFNGTTTFLSFPTGAMGNFRNKPWGYISAALMDTNTTGGNSNHYAIGYTPSGVNTSARFSMMTRGGGNNFRTQTRVLDADSPSNVSLASNPNYNVITSTARWMSGQLTIRTNATASNVSSALLSSGNTSNTDSMEGGIGKLGTSYFPGNVAGFITAAPSSEWSVVSQSRIERYLGMLAGINIPLSGSAPTFP